MSTRRSPRVASFLRRRPGEPGGIPMALTRRRLLRSAALGACALAAMSAPACRGPVREDLDESRPPRGRVRGLNPLLRDLLRWAALAPSSRNAQPWRVRLTGPRAFVLGVDPARRLAVSDPAGTDAIVALGAFLENFSLAARAQGLQVETRVLSTRPSDADQVEVTWEPGIAHDYPLARLTDRRTLRTGFASRPLAAGDLRMLLWPFGDHAVAIPADSPAGRMVAHATVEATRLQWRSRAARLEWSDWTRWRDPDARRHRDGLTPDAMEMSGAEYWWARATYSRSTVLTPAYAERVVQRTRERVRECGVWLVATSPDDSVSSLLALGARFERMALLLASLGIGAHPMQQLLEQAETRGAMGGALGTDEAPRLILRLGYVSRSSEAVSLRRPAEWFVSA